MSVTRKRPVLIKTTGGSPALDTPDHILDWENATEESLPYIDIKRVNNRTGNPKMPAVKHVHLTVPPQTDLQEFDRVIIDGTEHAIVQGPSLRGTSVYFTLKTLSDIKADEERNRATQKIRNIGR